MPFAFVGEDWRVIAINFIFINYSNNMLCPKCKNNGLVIEQAPDSRFKIVKCYSCPYWGWLKNFNKKTKSAIKADNNNK